MQPWFLGAAYCLGTLFIGFFFFHLKSFLQTCLILFIHIEASAHSAYVEMT